MPIKWATNAPALSEPSLHNMKDFGDEVFYFFKKEFGKTNIEVFIPTQERQQIINKIISEELELGIVKKESQSILIENISHLIQEHQIQAIVLGCTELPLALNSSNCPVPCIDIMEIHIQKLCELSQ